MLLKINDLVLEFACVRVGKIESRKLTKKNPRTLNFNF